MTAHAVSSPSAVAVAAKGAARRAPQDSAAVPFGHQLHTARKDQAAETQRRSSTHETPPQRTPDRTSDRRHDSPASARANSEDKRGNTAPNDPATGSRSKAVASSAPSAPAAEAVASAAAPVVVTAGSTTLDDAAPAESAADDEERAGAELVGAMLALIGPAMGKVLAPGTASPAAGRFPAGGPAAVALLPADAVVTTVNDGRVAPPVANPLLTAAALKAELKDMRDPAAPDSAAARPLAALANPTIGVPTAPVCVPVIAPVGTQAFTQELGQHVAWFVNQDIKEARIRLHPEELGSLDLKISVSHGRVDVNFQAQHPGAVLAVQQSLPQLDQMLAQHGLSLGNTEVGQQHDRGDPRGQGRADGDVSDTAEIHGASVVTPLRQLALLDAFA